MHVLEFKDFSALYRVDKKQFGIAVDNINLSVDSGEFLVIVGPSGSGKTTLLKSVLGSIDFIEGDILLDGTNINNIRKADRNLAYICQDYNLFPQMTVYENIAFPLRVMKTPQAEVDKRVKAIAQTLGVIDLLTRKPRYLSGGQIQRVEIARALVKNPRIVLFDEPFANLDPLIRTDMRLLVKKIHQEQRPTFLFITHDLTEALMLADRIVVMNDGEIVEVGTPNEIKTKPKSEFVKEFFNVGTTWDDD